MGIDTPPISSTGDNLLSVHTEGKSSTRTKRTDRSLERRAELFKKALSDTAPPDEKSLARPGSHLDGLPRRVGDGQSHRDADSSGGHVPFPGGGEQAATPTTGTDRLAQSGSLPGSLHQARGDHEVNSSGGHVPFPGGGEQAATPTTGTDRLAQSGSLHQARGDHEVNSSGGRVPHSGGEQAATPTIGMDRLAQSGSLHQARGDREVNSSGGRVPHSGGEQAATPTTGMDRLARSGSLPGSLHQARGDREVNSSGGRVPHSGGEQAATPTTGMDKSLQDKTDSGAQQDLQQLLAMQMMHSQTTALQHTEATHAPQTISSELVSEVAQRILVSADNSGGNKEVRIRIKDKILQDTEAVITREKGELTITFQTRAPADSVLLNDSRTAMTASLEKALGGPVNINIEADTDSQQERRSKGMYIEPEDND